MELPRDAMIVFTGLSGSGKSSLAFDTIFAEGQRRYVESLSAYARQFLGQMDKPDVDFIEGLSPAVSIDQKSTSRNPRSTVGTITEVYDYLRLLFARIGKPHCPVCGEPISKQTPQQIVDRILEMDEGTRFQVLAPVIRERKGEYVDLFADLQTKGYSRVRVDGVINSLTEPPKLKKQEKHSIEVVVDRLDRARAQQAAHHRLDRDRAPAGRRAGRARLRRPGRGRPAPRAPLLRAAGLPERPPAGRGRPGAAGLLVQLAVRRVPGVYRHRHPQGGRPGTARARPGAVAARAARSPRGPPGRPASTSCACCRAWPRPRVSTWTRRGRTCRTGRRSSCCTACPTRSTSATPTATGASGPTTPGTRASSAGSNGATPRPRATGRASKYEGYMREVPCPTCGGTRLKPEILAVTIGGRSIAEVSALSIGDANEFFRTVRLFGREKVIAERVLKEVHARLGFLVDVGLDYLSLDRASATLAGGEAQRIRLATQIGSGLVGVLYVLDEPSIGLHQRDNHRLIETLVRLKNLGNTLIVVEHDEDTIRTADWVVDIGPLAGEHGGEIVVSGTVADLLASERSLTGAYLSGRRRIEVPADPAQAREGPGARRRGRARAQPAQHRRHVPVGLPRRGDRRVRFGQVDAGQRHPLHLAGQPDQQGQAAAGPAQAGAWARARGQGRRGRPVARSGGRRARTRPPTPACSTTSASSSARPPRPRSAATNRAGSPSTSRVDAARPVPATAPSRSR